MYTSGSTGKPKGIAIPHRGIVRLVRDTDYVHLDANERIGQVSNISFDAATFEIWGALLNGGCLVGIDKDVVLTPDEFAATIRQQRITTMFLTSALFSQMARQAPDAFRTMRNLLVGGDAMDANAVRRVLRHGGPERLLNAYGPTETTTFALCHLVNQLADSAVSVPIGRPIANTRLYVLDQNCEPTPVGVPGELYIGGDGVARGYWNRAELTAARFVKNPFSDDPEDVLYRTGDLVRYRRDGVVEFIGRLDHQVKIRGFRIELDEIEQTLAQHPSIREALVVAREDTPGDKRVVAYIAATEPAPANAELRHWMGERLPEYMIPATFVAVDTLPLNANGKVDRAALPAPEPDRRETAETFVAPRTATETTLAGIWSEVLGIERVGVEENFFALGGHSLLATQVASRIKQTLGVEASLRLLFEAQTIAELASRLDVQGAGRMSAALRPRENRESPAPLSYAQQRLWFLDQLMPGNTMYNMPAVVRLRGELDVAALERAMTQVMERHETLRTTFHVVDGVAVQVVSEACIHRNGANRSTRVSGGGTRGGGAAAVGDGSAEGVRSRGRSFDSRDVDGSWRGRPRIAVHDAPHHQRRLVDWRVRAGSGGILRGARCRTSDSGRSVAGPVFRFQRVAARVAGRVTDVVVERAAGGRTAGDGFAV